MFFIIFGISLLICDRVAIFVISGRIRRFLVCTKEVEARVTDINKSYTEDVDPETGKKTRDYDYTVFFSYEYNGKSYEAERFINKSCSYSKNQKTKIKINPNHPENSKDCLIKGDLFELIQSVIGIVFLGFVTIFIFNCVMVQH